MKDSANPPDPSSLVLVVRRTINASPKMMVSTATIMGRKPEPGMDNCQTGRSPLSAMTSPPKTTNAAPAT